MCFISVYTAVTVNFPACGANKSINVSHVSESITNLF